MTNNYIPLTIITSNADIHKYLVHKRPYSLSVAIYYEKKQVYFLITAKQKLYFALSLTLNPYNYYSELSVKVKQYKCSLKKDT